MKYKRITNELNYGMNNNKKIYTRLKKLEDKIDGGTLIELPCKVGDTVYVLYATINNITKDKINSIRIKKHLIEFITNGGYALDIDNYNGNWFTSEAKAKKKLKEIQNPDNYSF